MVYSKEIFCLFGLFTRAVIISYYYYYYSNNNQCYEIIKVRSLSKYASNYCIVLSHILNQLLLCH